MKQFEIVDVFGNSVLVEAELCLYTAYDFLHTEMPILGIQLYSYDEEGFREPYATLTLNFGEFIGVKDCAYIDTNNCTFAPQLLTQGFCQDTGFTKNSGFCVYPLWKFDTDFLKAIDVNGLYEEYEGKFDAYMLQENGEPAFDREGEIVADVTSALGVVCEFDFDSDGLVVWANDSVYYGAEFYRYMLSEVCEYDSNGDIKGLDFTLCQDFYDLCEHYDVATTEHTRSASNPEVEFVITISSGGGLVQDFMTCSSRKEAEDICEGYDWTFVDENEFAWNLDIVEREVSLEQKLADAAARNSVTHDHETDKSDLEME